MNVLIKIPERAYLVLVRTYRNMYTEVRSVYILTILKRE